MTNSLKHILLEAVGDKDLIMDLIRNNRIATIYYKGEKENAPGWRTILPVAYGNHNSKTYGTKDYIRAWQWKGKSVGGIPEWKLFRTDRMTNWNLAATQVVNDVPDNRYNPAGDKWMDTLYIHAKFNRRGGESPDSGSEPKQPTPTPKSPGAGKKTTPIKKVTTKNPLTPTKTVNQVD